MPKSFPAMMFTLVLLLSFVFTGTVSAAEEQVKLGITPVGVDGSYFDVTLNPGETQELTVELANFGEGTVETRTYAADAYSLVGGGFGARLADEPTTGATHWLDYASERFFLEPGDALQRTFTVSVPNDAQPGEYLSSVVIQNAEPVAVSGNQGVGFNQVTRQVIAVAIDISGPRAPALAISGLEHKMVAENSVVIFNVENPGNVRLKPAGEFWLETADGAEVSRSSVAMDSVYAWTDTLVEVPLAEALEPGDYVGYLALHDEATGVEASSEPLSFNVPVPEAGSEAPAGDPAAEERSPVEVVADRVMEPWTLALVLLIGLVLGGVIAWVAARRRAPVVPTAPVVHEAPAVRHEDVPAAPVRNAGGQPAKIRPLIPRSDRSDRRTGTDS